MDNKLTRKIYCLFASAAVLFTALTAFFCGKITARADQPPQNDTATVNAVYYAFDGITAVHGNGTDFTVADANGVHVFSNGEVSEIALGGVTELNGGYALSGTSVYALSDVSTSVINGVYDFTTDGEFIYATVGNVIRTYSADGVLTDEISASGAITDIAATGGEVYYSVYSGGKCRIYTLGGEQVGGEYAHFSSFGELAAATEPLYVSKSGKLTYFNGEEVDGEYGYAMMGGGNCFATDFDEVYLISDGKAVLAAAKLSGEIGFYDTPSFVAARMGNVYICDTANNRVEVRDKQNVSYLAFDFPTAVCVDNTNAVFVAHAGGVTKIDMHDRTTYDVTNVKALTCDKDNRVIALSDGKLMLVDSGEQIGEACGVTALGTTYGGELVYAVGNVVHFAETSFTAVGEVNSICFDNADSGYYSASDGDAWGIYKHTADGETKLISTEGKSSVALLRAPSGEYRRGDILVADSVAAHVFTISAQAAGTLMPPSETTVDSADSENIIRTAAACTMYSDMTESEVKYYIPEGAAVMTVKYDVTEDATFSYVAYDAIGGDLVYGYVYRAVLSDPLPYVMPDAAVGTVYQDGAAIYALPSASSDKLVSDMVYGDELTILPFADYQNNNVGWYRVRSGNGVVGYAAKASVSLRGFNPDGVRPQYNGEIVAVGGAVSAKAYELKSGEYVELGVDILAGTKIEVVGNFDTSKKYTKIKFFDEELGTRECYVLTEFVHYNSVSIVQIVAIVLACVVGALTIATLVIVCTRKKKA